MKYTYNPETGLSEPVERPQHNSRERVGIALLTLGAVLLVISVTVLFDPINIKYIKFFYKLILGEADNVTMRIVSGPFTTTLGMFFFLFGIYLSDLIDFAQRPSHLRNLIITGIIITIILSLASWKRSEAAFVSCGELLQKGKIDKVKTELARLSEDTKDARYQSCIRQYADYQLRRVEKALKHDDANVVEKLLEDLKSRPGVGEMADVKDRIGNFKETLSYRAQLQLFEVPEKNYSIPEQHQLTDYLKKYVNGTRVKLEKPFKIQHNEVTVGAFRVYVEETGADVGDWWEKEHQSGSPHSDMRPVDNISWLEAKNYADWLSRKTGWDLRLPTVQQWVAASIEHAKNDPPVTGAGEIEEKIFPNKVNHLLANLREWAAESNGCNSPEKKRLLGENRFVDAHDTNVIGMENCADKDSAWTGVGFRLVRVMP